MIDALQELRDVERDLIVEQRNLIAIRIDLFRALGGPCRRRMTRSQFENNTASNTFRWAREQPK